MNLVEHAIARARSEYRVLGTLTTSTVMELGTLGLDADAIERQLASE